MAAKTTKKDVAEKTTTKKTATKKAPRKTVVDSTAVELPIEEVKEESVIEVEKINPEEEIFNKIIGRFKHTPFSDNEKAAAAKIYQNTKESLHESFSAENATIIAAAAADAALLSMANINKEAEHQKRLEQIVQQRKDRNEERIKARGERRELRNQRSQERSKSRAERKARLGIS